MKYGTYRGRGARGLKEFEHLEELRPGRERRLRNQLFLSKEEEIITVQVEDEEVHAKTTIGEVWLDENGKLYEDGVCFDD